MTLWFDDNDEYEVYISHTKVTLPSNKKDYELVFCYGLSEERPLILLTNKVMYCYNCQEASEESIKTISTTCTNEVPIENCAKKGNSYARIILLG